MKTNHVVVLPYDEKWKGEFEKIKAELENALESLIVSVEHVGSTAVEGICAKPIIDIDVVISDYSIFETVVEKLRRIGYMHEGDLGIKGREAFAYEEKPHLQKHHLYVCPENSEELRRHIVFRNFLQMNSEAAKKYGDVKRKAAELFPDNIEKYMEYKSSCIKELYAACGLE